MSVPPLDRATDVRRLLERTLPDLAVRSVTRMGSGADHVAYEVNGDLIVRFATNPAPGGRAGQVRTEARVLATVRELTSLTVPDPHLVDEDAGVMAYRKIPGTPLIELREDLSHLDIARFGDVIGELLSRLHQLPVGAVEAFVPREDESLAEWLTAACQDYERVAEWVPSAMRTPIEAFLAKPPPPNPQVAAFCHNDLGIEHLIMDPAALVVTGIIDWADAAITDPAYDLALLYRDLGAEALTSVLDHYGGAAEPIEDLRLRAEFYARCSVFEDLVYGLDPGHDLYLAQGLAALEHLFRQ